MISEFVRLWEERKEELRQKFRKKHPDEYKDVVKAVIEILDTGGYSDPSPDRIHTINDGEYQGTLVFVIGAKGYQPSDYWYVKVGYGSCSGCDTLESIHKYTDSPPTEDQVNKYMTLAMHIVQWIKKMGEEVV